MALTKSTPGEDLIRYDNVRAKKLGTGYTAPALGDLVTMSTTVADSVIRGAVDTNPYGMVISINSSNGTVSVVEFKDGVTVVLEYTGTAPALGEKIECVGDRGTVITTRDRVQVDDTNGIGAVIAVDASSPAGTGTCVVRFS